MNDYPIGRWDATDYFKQLTATNRLAKEQGFTFCSVSGLDGFEEALDHMQRSKALVCVSGLHRASQHSPHAASEDGVPGDATPH